jgi:hexosaminidase
MRTLMVLLLISGCANAQWRVMPMPASIRAGEGRMAIQPGFSIPVDRVDSAEPRIGRAIERMRVHITMLTGIRPVTTPGPVSLVVRVNGLAKPVQSIDEDESYRLEITPSQALLTAPNVLGAMHGLETFFQLIENTADGWSVPAVTIDDQPRFVWRGLMLDVSRHFMPLDVVRRTLDGMAAVKLNVFHWHLSDDQGFRVESKKYPKLHELGSDGNYYTQDQIRGVIEYARDRGIRVVPEFDIPGHSASWLVGYPELGAASGPYRIVRTWGISDPTMDPANPQVYAFLDTFIGEMASLFPDAWFHIGGDEVNGHEWNANTTDIPAFMKEHGFTTQHDLQVYFNQQVQKILTKYGKRTEGWDEILNPALPKDNVNPNYTQSTPLNRLVDVARPDSTVARHFSELVDRYLWNKKDMAARDEIKRWLILWSGNDAKVQAMASRRAILREAAPVSAILAKISAQALASMATGTPHKTSADLQTARKPIGEVSIAVAPPIARLREGAR